MVEIHWILQFFQALWIRLYHLFLLTVSFPFGSRKCIYGDCIIGFPPPKIANPSVVWSTWNQFIFHIFHIWSKTAWQIHIRRRLQSTAFQVIPNGGKHRGCHICPFRFSQFNFTPVNVGCKHISHQRVDVSSLSVLSTTSCARRLNTSN